MFADDTLFYKNDESVKKSFDILTIYEKASGSTVNYEKTKGMYIGSAKANMQSLVSIYSPSFPPGNLTPCISLSPL
jgi:hypothetical protein